MKLQILYKIPLCLPHEVYLPLAEIPGRPFHLERPHPPHCSNATVGTTRSRFKGNEELDMIITAIASGTLSTALPYLFVP
jgi:hypothetical protein